MSFILNNLTIKIQSFTANKAFILEDGTQGWNVVCYLLRYPNNAIEPDDQPYSVSIDNLSEKQINLKELYKRVMALPEHEGSEKS